MVVAAEHVQVASELVCLQTQAASTIPSESDLRMGSIDQARRARASGRADQHDIDEDGQLHRVQCMHHVARCDRCVTR